MAGFPRPEYPTISVFSRPCDKRAVKRGKAGPAAELAANFNGNSLCGHVRRLGLARTFAIFAQLQPRPCRNHRRRIAAAARGHGRRACAAMLGEPARPSRELARGKGRTRVTLHLGPKATLRAAHAICTIPFAGPLRHITPSRDQPSCPEAAAADDRRAARYTPRQSFAYIAASERLLENRRPARNPVEATNPLIGRRLRSRLGTA